MTRAGVLALWIVALSLLVDLSVYIVWPWSLVTIERRAFLTAAAACHEARASVSDTDFKQRLGPSLSRRLHTSEQIAMTACLDVKLLRARLEAAGVPLGYLDYLDALALDHSKASLDYISNFVRSR